MSVPRRGLPDRRVWIAVVLLVVVAVAYWIWVGLHRSIDGDEGISILAGRAVLERGWPILPSGMVYRKGIVTSYFLAAAFRALGVGDLAITLPSAACGAGTLILTTLVARDLFGRAYAGLLAGVALVLASTESFYVSGPRMYAALQFFAVASLYGGWHGFVLDRRWGRTVTFVALLGAVLSHAQSGALLVAVPVSVAFAFGRSRPDARRRRMLFLAAVSWGTLVGVWLWTGLAQQLPGHSPRIVDAGGQNPENFHLALDPGRALAQVWMLETLVPLGALVAPLVVLSVWDAWKARQAHGRGTLFAAAWWSVSTAITLVATGPVHPRIWIMTLPVYLLLVITGVGHGFRTLLPAGRSRGRAVAAVGWAALLVCATSLHFGAARYPRMLVDAYRRPGSRPTDRCAPAVKEAHRELQRVLLPGDEIVATNPWITDYYLGRVDAFLRERRDPDSPTGFRAFSSPSDEYLGIPLIDTPEELAAVADRRRRSWIVIDPKFERYASAATHAFVERVLTRYMQSDLLEIYTDLTPGEIAAMRRAEPPS
ncbi:MAG: glycosyltransferase family 39 protein [Candidatus Eisenbacteria bacterium]